VKTRYHCAAIMPRECLRRAHCRAHLPKIIAPAANPAATLPNLREEKHHG
jgi:hypothetical protein